MRSGPAPRWAIQAGSQSHTGGSCTSFTLEAPIPKFLIFEQGAPRFHFVLGPAWYVARPAPLPLVFHVESLVSGQAPLEGPCFKACTPVTERGKISHPEPLTLEGGDS